MSHSIVKQAIPIELLEQIRSNEKLQILIKEIWSYGSGMFLWFNALPTSDPDYFREPTIDVFIQDYEEDYEAFNDSEDKRLFPFTPGKDLNTYCDLLEQLLEQFKAEDPLLAQRKIYFGTRIDGLVHSCLLKVLEIKFPLNTQLADLAIWGGEHINSSNLRYLTSGQVKEIAQILCKIRVDELLHHFDTSVYAPEDWLEDCRKASQEFKRCFAEAAEKEQVILTTII